MKLGRTPTGFTVCPIPDLRVPIQDELQTRSPPASRSVLDCGSPEIVSKLEHFYRLYVQQGHMPKQIAPDHNVQFLFPPALEDWVAQDHPARFLREFVGQLDLGALGFRNPEPGAEGRPAYASTLLLTIWLFGYLHRIRSTRKLEIACREQLSLLWLTGMIQPDHNSLWRFWRDNKKALRAVFKRSAQLAVELGLVGFVLQALDGTKIQAASSGHTGWNKKSLEALVQALDRELDQTEAQIEQEGSPAAGPGYRLPESLADKQALRDKLRAGLEQMETIGREHHHPHESEARRMSCDGRNRFGYNAQAVVDDKAGVIVGAEVTNTENDSGLAVPMMQQAQENCGRQAAATVADSGYGNGKDIAQAAQAQMNLLVRPKGDGDAENKPYHAFNFRFEPQRDVVICPQNRELHYARDQKQKGQVVRIFRCDHYDCPVRSACTQDQRSRRFIEIWPHTVAVQAMRQKAKQTDATEQLRKRREVVERIFGHIKHHESWRRWTTRGLENVNAQWAMICCAFNLRLIFRKWSAPPA
jgi:transposase